ARIVLAGSSQALEQILGIALILYSLFLGMNPTFAISETKLSCALGGLISGFLAGVFGMRGALKSSFLLSCHLELQDYLATMGAISILIDTIRMITYWYGGITLSPLLQWALVWSVPASYLAAWIGSICIPYIPEKGFRSFIALSLFVIGIWIVVVAKT